MDESDGKAEKATLTPRQRLAVEALLKTGSPTKAAETAGVIRQTVHRWMHQPAFAAALAQAETDALAALSRRLVDLGGTAATTLEDAMKYDVKAPGARVTAASAVLGNLLKLREVVALEDRVAALEAALLDKEKGVKP